MGDEVGGGSRVSGERGGAPVDAVGEDGGGEERRRGAPPGLGTTPWSPREECAEHFSFL